ncbi:MAG: SRPBCC family protein [Bacteroidales bacterium]
MIILYIILGLVAVVLIVPLFLKKDYAVVKEILIEKPKQQVFDYVKLLKNQDNYSVWALMDPNMKKGFSGIDGTAGCISTWESLHKNVGTGEQEIKGIKEGERIDYELRFLKPFKSTSLAFMTTEAVSENQTRVKWGFSGKMNYPMNLMLLFMNMEAAIGKDFNTGLGNLKSILEK